MPRKHVRTTARAGFSETDILSAVKRVVDNGAKVRAVAVESGIDRMTLTRYIKEFHNGDLKSHFGYWGNRRVFNEEEEIVLSEYLQTSSKICFGLTPNEVQKLAFEYADKNNKHIPLNWRANNSAGLDWFQGFMQRHREISLSGRSHRKRVV
jgi:transposase-like protein